MFEINNFIIILQHVRCVYPIEETETGYLFSFKFSDGFYEQFTFKTLEQASEIRKKFIETLNIYWNSK